MYRTIKYTGESKKVLLKRIEEIEKRGEEINFFTIDTFEEKVVEPTLPLPLF